MQIIECQQNSPEWFEARRGIPTASEFATVMARTPGGKAYGKTRQTYMRKLAGEIVTGKPMDSYSNGHMDRGHEMEGDARRFYAFMSDATPELVGFIRNGEKGCSPDSLIGKSGMLEIKSKAPHLLIEWIEKDQFPPEHKAQCQGQLWVAEREWVDIVGYWPDMPLFVKREYRDEAYIENMAFEVERFNEELAGVVEQVRRYGSLPAAA